MLKRLLKTAAWILGILAALPVVMNLADCISSSIYLVEKLWRNAALI